MRKFENMDRLFKNVRTFFIMVSLFVGLNGSKPVPPTDNRINEVGYFPVEGFVPNDSTAIKIAEIVWINIYGCDVLQKRPYKAKLKNGIWVVEGSLPANYKGGVPYLLIQKKDGKILKVMHGK